MTLSLVFSPPIHVKFVTKGGSLETALKPTLWPVDSYDKGIITLDASIQEQHGFSASVPDHPIEAASGESNVAVMFAQDHYIRHPRTLSIEGTITDAPVQYLSILATGDFSMGPFSGSLTRSMKAYEAIRQMWLDGTPFDVITGFDLYKNMVFTDLTIPRSARIGRRLRFQANMKQITFIKTDPVLETGFDLAEIVSDLGYLTKQTPNAVTLAGAALFIGLIGWAYLGPG